MRVGWTEGRVWHCEQMRMIRRVLWVDAERSEWARNVAGREVIESALIELDLPHNLAFINPPKEIADGQEPRIG